MRLLVLLGLLLALVALQWHVTVVHACLADGAHGHEPAESMMSRAQPFSSLQGSSRNRTPREIDAASSSSSSGSGPFTTVLQQCYAASKAYATDFFTHEMTLLGLAPRKKLAVVTCMDARIDPLHLLGLQLGDAHIIRNAGGRVADALRSLIISQTLLGTREVAIIHHTDCGMTKFSDESLREQLRQERGVDADHIAFLPFTDVDASVRADLRLYNRSDLVLQGIPVRGFVYDVHSGALREIEPQADDDDGTAEKPTL